MNTELTLETTIDLNFKGNHRRGTISEMYCEETHGDLEDFLIMVQAWIQTGRCTIIDTRGTDEKEADKVIEELMAVQNGKTIEQDRIQRQNHNQESLGVYGKVGFPAKTLMQAQEMHQIMIKNFNLSPTQLGVEMNEGKVVATVTNCPIKVYIKISRAFGIQRASEAVSGTVDKVANSAVNTADMTINTLAVPVAKTAIGTTAKIAKSLFGLGAKIGGVAVGEFTKNAKQCVTEIQNDAYIAEAKGEVIDGYHAVKRTLNKNGGLGGGGMILEN